MMPSRTLGNTLSLLALAGVSVLTLEADAQTQGVTKAAPAGSVVSPKKKAQQSTPGRQSAVQELPEGEEDGEPVANPSLPQKETLLPEESEKLRREREHAARLKWRKLNPAGGLPERADVLALTVSGGVSLGSYEAGLLHLLTEALRRSPGSAALKVVTGASAGSANAIIAGTDACLNVIEQPEKSLGYETWVNVGLDQLFDPERVTQSSIFVRDPLVSGFGNIASRWGKGLPKDCEFVFGVTTTRKEGYDVHLADGLVVPRLAERFLVRVEGRGDNLAPVFNNYLDPSQNFERPLLPLSAGADPAGKKDFAAIEQVVLASAAFPVALPPQSIEHCVTARRTEATANGQEVQVPHCDAATRVDQFIDGGVFDNNPLGIAYKTASAGLVATDSGSDFRPVPTGGPEKRPEIVYGYIDPGLRNYSVYQPPVQEDGEKQDPILGLLTRLGGQAISSARGQELAALAERTPRALHRLWLMEGSYPPVSELIASFFGFFEKDFRDFDFHLGSYEAYRDLRDHSGTMLGVERFLEDFEKQMAGETKSIPARYRKLGCILSHLESDRYAHLQPLCGGTKMRNFRVLLQMTIDRLWANCRLLSEARVAERAHLQCKRAQGGIEVPQVDPDLVPPKKRYRQQEEDEFEYVMRLLSAYEFEFKDLGLSRAQSKWGLRAVRRRLAEMVTALANAQPAFTQRTLVLTVGRMVVNGLDYEPPASRWYVMLGSSLAFGHLGRIGQNSSFYWNPDIRIHNLRTLVTDRPDEFAASASFGAEWAVSPLSGSIVQSAVGLRGGYQFSAEDAIGFKACDQDKVSLDSRYCSQPIIQVPLSLTLLERVRFTATPVFFPMPQPWEDAKHSIFDLELGIGAEFF